MIKIEEVEQLLCDLTIPLAGMITLIKDHASKEDALKLLRKLDEALEKKQLLIYETLEEIEHKRT